MTQVPHPQEPPPDLLTSAAPGRRSDHSPWNWLLLIPIVLPLLVPIYNRWDGAFILPLLQSGVWMRGAGSCWPGRDWRVW